MERRGEGFERERYVPGREPGREGVEREAYHEPLARENITEPRVERRESYDVNEEPGVMLRTRDLLRWGPVFGGFVLSMSLVVLLAVIGTAIGAGFITPIGPPGGPATAATVWGAITPPAAPGMSPGAPGPGTAQSAAWGSAIALLLGLVSAAIGS